jgi:hypothetical protein
MAEIVNRDDTNHLVRWSDRGDSFIVEDPEE